MKLIQFFFIMLLACPLMAEKTNRPDVVREVNLRSFDGLYYEIASLPQESKKYCYQNSQISFELLRNGQEFDVIRTCYREDGLELTTSGRAKSDSPTGNKLRMTFVHITDWIWSLSDNLWFLAVGPNYEWVLLADPDRDEAWIYSRSPKLSREILSKLSMTLKEQAYDPCEMLMTRTSEYHPKTQDRLCDLAQ